MVLYVLPQNAQKIRNCFCRGLKKVRNHGYGVRPCGFYLRTILPGDTANGH